ncbi:LruC domain-containing protein [Chitinibacter sp. SCUT-21]|uniref:LruC domain-containing protein n=1 Tax=Chitinibacter sp. SCUT-21 TaxID=2970891 RepID=UPI0035A6896B
MKAIIIKCCLGVVLACASIFAHAEIASTRLADTIKSSGSGNINLLLASGNVAISAAQLEQYRLLHTDTTLGSTRYFLSLGVDVNENNKGLETSTAQGIAIGSLSLKVTRAGGVTTYTNYRTRTKALIAPAGTTARQNYYTVLGEGGSSRITGSNAIQSQFDSTLDIFVPDSLADALQIELSVSLLSVNKTLGDPESFYDFSGGFEDLALLNNSDAYFLNNTLKETASFDDQAPISEAVTVVSSDTAVAPPPTPSSWTYFPSATGWYKIAYEDKFPELGDYDFNDAVIAYRYKLGLDASGNVIRIESEAYLLADGALNELNWQWRLPVAGSGTVSCSLRMVGQTVGTACPASMQGGVLSATMFPQISDATQYFVGSGGSFANTVCPSSKIDGPYASMSLVLASPVALAAIGAPDPQLNVVTTGRTITLASRDPNNFPYALIFPSSWNHPCEKVDMGLAYPQYLTFLQSGGTQAQTWYANPASGLTFGGSMNTYTWAN